MTCKRFPLLCLMPFICLLTAYICIMVYFTVYGCKIVSRQFYAISQKD
nr:MAG TPA: hypothetical protein [Caudoviricetes sp.]